MRLIIALLIAAMLALAGCTDEPTDPETTDTDGDGFTDAQEEAAGTDPEDAEDVPAEEEESAPDIQTEFVFGPGAGCAGDVLQIVDDTTGAGTNCASFVNGPDQPAVDGHWVALTEDYAGLEFTTQMTPEQEDPSGTGLAGVGDTDCFAVDGAGARMATDYDNGADPCSGTIPNNAAYLFVYSYAAPHETLTVTFIV